MDARERVTLAAVALALALPLAGCTSGAPPVESAASSPDPVDPPPADAASDAAPDAAPAPPPEPVEVPVSFDGETGTWGCAFTPDGAHCVGQFSTTTAAELAYRGTPLRLAGTVTWNATTPAGDELEVVVFPVTDGESDFDGAVVLARGSSPLAFDGDLREFAGREIHVDVNSAHGQATPAGELAASLAQAFHFEGAFTFQPDA